MIKNLTLIFSMTFFLMIKSRLKALRKICILNSFRKIKKIEGKASFNVFEDFKIKE